MSVSVDYTTNAISLKCFFELFTWYAPFIRIPVRDFSCSLDTDCIRIQHHIGGCHCAYPPAQQPDQVCAA